MKICRDRRAASLLWLLVLAAAAGLFSSCKRAPVSPETDDSAVRSVPVARVTRQDLSQKEVIPAEFRAYVSVLLHAKVSGYLDRMNVDFGDRVTNGQLLATIEVPELQDQLNNAIGVQERAEADYTNTHLIYERLDKVRKEHPDLVAQQDIDTAYAKDSESVAAIAAAKADVGRYQTMASYTNIYAPFDGLITHRFVDPGALVEAGTSAANIQPLLEISDNYLLRLDFPVSVGYVQDIKVGGLISGVVESLNGKPFSGKITRATWQVNDDTRTMTTEIEVTNGDLTLVPGMYASVSIPVEVHPHALTIPIEAVPPGETNSVYVINQDNVVENRPVTLGMYTSSSYEVLSGLKEGEMVLTGSRAQARPGEKVQPKEAGAPLAEK